MNILDKVEQVELRKAITEVPDFKLPNTECHKKPFYDLPSIQIKLGITKFDLDRAWAQREDDKPVYLCYSKDLDRHFWISNYTV